LYGGAETVIVHLARYLSARGVDVSILTADFELRPEYKHLNVIVPLAEKQIHYRIRGEKFSDVVDVFRIVNLLRNYLLKVANQFDVLNPHNFPATWAVPRGKPTIWMCNELPDFWHGISRPLFRKVAGFAYFLDRYFINSRVDVAVVSDQKNAESFYNRYGRWPRIIHYGIEGEFFSKPPSRSEEYLVRKKYQLRDDSFYVIHVGMISPSKNQLETLRALWKLKCSVPNIKVIFAGFKQNTQYTSLLNDFIGQKSLEGDVIFTGHVSKDELRVLYHISHVLVLPGIGQGSWLSPFEALAAEKPVIVSPYLTNSSIIDRMGLGIVTSDYAKAILEVYENYPCYKEKARKGKEFVLSELSWDRFCEKYLAILNSMALK